MGARKRRHHEMEESQTNEAGPEPSLLSKIRNTWEFANLMQYIYIFGKAVKIDENLDIEDLESECCKPEPSSVLSDIGLALLKYVSSHRGLTPEIFDEYTRRQYVAKAEHRNPFGVDPEPKKFADFDVFQKLKVLVQLSQWTLNNAERIREKMEERGELEQSRAWRINEIGYDRHDRDYYALDDNRLYRRTEAPPPPPPEPKSKKRKPKKSKSYPHGPKRRRTRQSEQEVGDADVESNQAEEDEDESVQTPRPVDDGFGGRKWECVAINLTEYQEFLNSIAKSRDPNEKSLHKTISTDILPIIESAQASQLRKQQKHERELLNLQKLAGAKRSTRIEAKLEREKQERDAIEAEVKIKADLADAEAYKKRQEKMEMDRESRMMTREQRIKEREMKRILHEQELAKMSEEEKKVDAGESRLSERTLKAEMAKRKRELAALEQEDDWTFDCSKCGKHGANWDDGTHSVACERCNVWQHSACLGISQTDAEKEDFHFVCDTCRRREEDARKPKIPSLKFRVGPSASPPEQKPQVVVPLQTDSTIRRLDPAPGSLHAAQQPNGPPVQTFRPPQASMNGSQNLRMPDHPRQGQQEVSSASLPVMQMQSGSANGAIQPRAQYTHHSPEAVNGYRPPVQTFQPRQYMPNGFSQHGPSPAAAYQATGFNGYRNATPGSSNGQTSPPLAAHPGWSARYIPPPTEQRSHPSHGSSPSYQQSSLSGSSTSKASPNFTTPVQPQALQPANGTKAFLPPPQTPHLSSTSRPSASATPHVNGYAVNNAPAVQPVGPPSISPVKHASPPNGHSTPFSVGPAATPLSRPPSFPADQVVTSPGYSPVKHDSPKVQEGSLALGQVSNVTSLPPIAKLAPSPVSQTSGPPLKNTSAVHVTNNLPAPNPDRSGEAP